MARKYPTVSELQQRQLDYCCCYSRRLELKLPITSVVINCILDLQNILLVSKDGGRVLLIVSLVGRDYCFQGGIASVVAAYVIYNGAERHRDLGPRNLISADGRLVRSFGALHPHHATSRYGYSWRFLDLRYGWDGLW